MVAQRKCRAFRTQEALSIDLVSERQSTPLPSGFTLGHPIPDRRCRILPASAGNTLEPQEMVKYMRVVDYILHIAAVVGVASQCAAALLRSAQGRGRIFRLHSRRKCEAYAMHTAKPGGQAR